MDGYFEQEMWNESEIKIFGRKYGIEPRGKT